MVPSDTVGIANDGGASGVYMASGTTASCTAQGFLATLSIGASMSYYAVLMLLYWMSVHYGWSESFMSKTRFRMYFILPPTIIALGFAIPPLFLGMYNYGGTYQCFIATYPLDCEINPEHDCIRGHGAWIYQDIYWFYCLLCNVVIIVCVCMLIYTVFNQERKADKYLTKGQAKKRDMTRKTVWQGLRYVVAFMMAYIFMYIWTFYRLFNTYPPEAIFYLHLIFPPLLGFFNAFVYFRPRFIAYRDNNPDDSWVVCLSNVFNIDLDYLENSRSKMNKRLSSISRKSISASISRSISGRTSSERSSADSID